MQAQKADWDALAEEENLTYELLEPSLPPFLQQGDSEICSHLWKNGVPVTALHGAFIDVNPASGDPLFRQLSRRRCEESCQLAESLGAEIVVFHSSCAPFLDGDYRKHWAEDCTLFYRQLAETHPALTICIENSMDVSPTPLQMLMQHPERHPRVQTCLDIGHASYSRTPLSEWFHALGEYIGCLHLSDNHRLYDDHLPLGAGSIDWESADRFWRGLPHAVPITLEVGRISGVRQSLAWLRSQHYFGMG